MKDKFKKISKMINFVILSAFFIAGCVNPEEEQINDQVSPEETVAIETQEATETVTQETHKDEQSMTESKKIAVVVARDRYQSLEFNPVVDALKVAGYEVVIVSDALGTAKGTTENTEVEVDFANLYAKDYMGIVIIGGSNSLWENGELHAVLMEMDMDDKLVAAICYGSVVLAEAGVIGEGDVACWYNSSESDPVMQKYGVEDSGADVTIAENIITGDGPNAAEEFAEVIVEFLN